MGLVHPLFFSAFLTKKIWNMSSMLASSPGLVLATAMAVSGTVIFLALRREKNFPPTHFLKIQDSHPAKPILRSCLCSDGKKREREKKKKKKKVQFAESVKDQTGDGEEYRKEHNKKSTALESQRSCRGEIDQANRVALCSGILRDRIQRLECSY